MFTGIVEEVGRMLAVPPAGRAGALRVAASTVLADARLGDSIAVNGVCLTVTDLAADAFSADVMPETLSRSNLGALKPGSRVNLERAMAAGGRFGGHIVSGHIDGCGRVVSRTQDQNAVRVRVSCTPAVHALVVEKGSVAIDGISLTVSRLFEDGFEVSVIPHTGGQTTLLGRRPGDVVNLENDVVGKYVQRLLGVRAQQAAASPAPGSTEAREPLGGITLDFLTASGF